MYFFIRSGYLSWRPLYYFDMYVQFTFLTQEVYAMHNVSRLVLYLPFVIACFVSFFIDYPHFQSFYFFISNYTLIYRYMMQFGFKKNRRVPLATVSDNNVSNPLSPPQFTSRLDDESREEEQRRMSTQLARRLNSAQNRSSRLSLSRASRTYAGSKGNSFSMRESAATSARGSSRGGDVTKNA